MLSKRTGERANGQASGPVLTFRLFSSLNHRGAAEGTTNVVAADGEGAVFGGVDDEAGNGESSCDDDTSDETEDDLTDTEDDLRVAKRKKAMQAAFFRRFQKTSKNYERVRASTAREVSGHAKGPGPSKSRKKNGAGAEAKSMSSVSCSVCGEAIHGPPHTLRKRLAKHRRSHKSPEKLQKCGTCGKAYTFWKSLIRHYATHWPPYRCTYDKCTKMFSRVSRLKEHVREEFHFNCQFGCRCGCVYLLKENFQDHLEDCGQEVEEIEDF